MNSIPRVFESGVLKHVSGEEHTFEMRLLSEVDLGKMCVLRDDIEKTIPEWDLLLPTPNAVLLKGLGNTGMTCGTLVGERLVGLRSIYFPNPSDAENIGRDAAIPPSELGTVVELKLSLVDMEYRRNGLQKRMTAHLMNALMAQDRNYFHCCAIVSPKNIPSLSDKFAFNMTLSTLMFKHNTYWRCLFTKDLRKQHVIPENSAVYANNRDFKRQSQLLRSGYNGYKLKKMSSTSSAILYAK